MSSVTFVEPTAKDRFLAVFFSLLFIAVMILSGFFLIESYGIVSALIIFTLAIIILVKWHADTRGFKCGHCGHEFSISFWQDLPTASSIPFMKKMLKCPACAYKDYATEVIKKNQK